MTIKQVKTGWQVNIQPGGRGAKRVKKTFEKKADALAWERHVRAKVQESPDWAPARKDARPLAELCTLWFNLHGQGLRAGEDTYRRLIAMCEAMGNPRAETFTAEVFAEYRKKRIDDGVTPNNMNREHAYLRAVFNELIRLGHWKRDNPLKLLRAFKIQERQLSYLKAEEISQLLESLAASNNRNVELIARICLETGARWSEAESLRTTHVHGNMVQFSQTKSSKTRAVPVRAELVQRLKDHHATHGVGERYFTDAANQWAFSEAVKAAGLTLPTGQATHVLRHTFASHFMRNGGNILALQKILGHQSLTMTMRYAHVAPDHLIEATAFNPLAKPAL
jgi:integrase